MNYSDLNRWQKFYCQEYHNSKLPKTKAGKEALELLSKVDKTITVEFPDHTDTLKVTERTCNIPEGIISVPVLVSNLRLWTSRGLNISYEDNTDYMELFQKERDGWSHEYVSAAITNTTLEQVVEVAKKYAPLSNYHNFESCFNNGFEKDGVVTFTAYREDPDSIASFFSKHLPNSVVYADVGWDYHWFSVMKNGEEYNGYSARWKESEPDGYQEDWDVEENEDEADTYYDCDVILQDSETGYEFCTGGGMCSESEFEEYCRIISTHPYVHPSISR